MSIFHSKIYSFLLKILKMYSKDKYKNLLISSGKFVSWSDLEYIYILYNIAKVT